MRSMLKISWNLLSDLHWKPSETYEDVYLIDCNQNQRIIVNAMILSLAAESMVQQNYGIEFSHPSFRLIANHGWRAQFDLLFNP